MLVGREPERSELESLLSNARAGRSGSLVLHGPAGVGKSALVEHAAACADGMVVLRATGVEPERELSFAALHQLVRPLFDQLSELPGPQRDALEAALALAPGAGADRFVVSAALLTLLAGAAGDRGLVCLVDDAQWLDDASLDALLFSARRLDVEGVALIIGVRDGELEHPLARVLNSLVIGPLSVGDAQEILSGTSGAAASEAVATALQQSTDGNALALSELGGLLSADVLQGRSPIPDPLPIGSGMENAFLTRVRTLPPDTQLMLLVGAAEGTGDLATVVDAAERLGAPGSSFEAAEASGLVHVTAGRLQFRHPLVRSAVYSGVSFSQRRSAHAALAEVLEVAGETDRRAWHRAEATLGMDDQVADDLAASAEQARLRSGFAGAAAMLQKSAQLTRDPGVRAERLVSSAQDFWLGGRPESAAARLDEATRYAGDAGTKAAIGHMRARFEIRRGDAADAFRMLFDEATAAAERSPEHALQMFAEASDAASYAGDAGGMIAAGRGAEQVALTSSVEAEFCRDQCVGVADLFEGRRESGVERLRRVIEVAPALKHPQQLVLAGTACTYLGEINIAFDFLERAVAAARVADMTGDLPYVLEFLAASETGRGRFGLSQAMSDEGLTLAIETGQDTSRCQHLANLAHLAAWRGDESECRRCADEVVDLAHARRLGFPLARVEWAVGFLDLGLGRFSESLTRLKALCEAGPGRGHPAVAYASTLDRVEAAVRCEDWEHASATVDIMEVQTAAADSWPRAVAACCRALVSPPDEAQSHFERALELHSDGRTPTHHVARTQLLYGEWLRRERRRSESREYLRAAMKTFDQIGAAPWSARARGELRASGETVASRDVDTFDRLTPQELRIAKAAAAGESSKDIAARLYLSPRTVEYHLYKVFPKLGVSSRVELARLIAANPAIVEGVG